MPAGGGLSDRFGRTLDYLRISVTDRCDLRCIYCVPPEGVPHVRRADILRFEEIERIVRVFVAMGLRRLRITGGEPLCRRDLPRLIERLAAIPGLEPPALTTNGTQLAGSVEALRAAGLGRINVSLDSLDAERFRRITGCGDIRGPLEGIRQAARIGLDPKVNVVILPDLTDEEILGFAEYAADEGIEVRFIEFMPLCGSAWRPARFIPASRVENVLRRHHRLERLEAPADAVAEVYRLDGGPGRVGLIASISRPFCSSCSRLRLTADGTLKPCLFSRLGVPLRPLLGEGASDEAIAAAIRRAVLEKPEGHGLEASALDREDPLGRPFIRTLGG